MTRNLRARIETLEEEQARGILSALVIYLEALEALFQKSETLPQSTKITASTTLEELDYLLGVYTEKRFNYPRPN